MKSFSLVCINRGLFMKSFLLVCIIRGLFTKIFSQCVSTEVCSFKFLPSVY